MDSIARTCVVGIFVVAAVLAVAAVAPDAAILEFDPFHPATLWPVVVAGAHEVVAPIRAWLDTTATHLREVLHRTKLREVLSQ
jgi:hypothetical protein